MQGNPNLKCSALYCNAMQCAALYCNAMQCNAMQIRSRGILLGCAMQLAWEAAVCCAQQAIGSAAGEAAVAKRRRFATHRR
eukprot:6864610-Lingulodinium_polyedra.AAC.1